MNKISVTILESFRRFKDDVSSFDTEENLIKLLKGEFKGNNKMFIGSAIHSLIDNYPNIKQGKVKLSDTQIIKIHEHCNKLGVFYSEIPANKVFYTNKNELKITGRIDVLQGITIRDTKCKFSSPSYSGYYDSYQWRVYLSIFELDRFIYDIFEIENYNDAMEINISDCNLTIHEPYECLKYDKMEYDINSLIDEFMEWINFRKLENLISK